MIHGRHSCQDLESVVVAVEGGGTPEGLGFVSALGRVQQIALGLGSHRAEGTQHPFMADDSGAGG